MILSLQITLVSHRVVACPHCFLLFIQYTDSLVSYYDNVFILKYADDTAIIGMCNDKNSNYYAAIEYTVNWCKDYSLFINGKKTKEMIVDNLRTVQSHAPVYIDRTLRD